MFEKEAKEYATDNYETCLYDDFRYANDSRAREQSFKDGAEFGYNKAKIEAEESYKETFCNIEMNLRSVTERLEELNKANEWHYVKDGDLPTKEQEEKQLLVRVRNYTEDFIFAYYMLDKYYSPRGKRFYYDTECDSPINIKNIIAWKEIIPPKEIE